MVKLVYTPALGAGPFGGGGSSPLLGTKTKKSKAKALDFCRFVVPGEDLKDGSGIQDESASACRSVGVAWLMNEVN